MGGIAIHDNSERGLEDLSLITTEYYLRWSVVLSTSDSSEINRTTF